MHEWGSPELRAQNHSCRSYQLDLAVKCQTKEVKQNGSKSIPKSQIKTRDSDCLPGVELLIVGFTHWLNRKKPLGKWFHEIIGCVVEGSMQKMTSRAYGQGFPAHVFHVWLKIIGALALVGPLGDGSHCIASSPVTASWISSVPSNEWMDGQMRCDMMRRCERQGIKMTSTVPGT